MKHNLNKNYREQAYPVEDQKIRIPLTQPQKKIQSLQTSTKAGLIQGGTQSTTNAATLSKNIVGAP
jgi:hypothetical protein